MAHPRRQLLSRRVDEEGGRVLVPGEVPRLHDRHAIVLEGSGIAVARRQQVAAERDCVLALLGGPEVRPLRERPARREAIGDLGVVVRQVVLGEEVEDESGADLGRHRRLRRIPRLVDEAPALLPRDELMGVPVLTPLAVLVDECLDGGLDGVQQLELLGAQGVSPSCGGDGPLCRGPGHPTRRDAIDAAESGTAWRCRRPTSA